MNRKLEISKLTDTYAARMGVHHRSGAYGVLSFMIAFDQLPCLGSEVPSSKDIELAHKLIEEECVKELLPALQDYAKSPTLEHLLHVADGAIDTIYVCYWALLKFGLSPDKLFELVQSSNMAKLNEDGTYTKHPETGKVQKPASWQPPDLMPQLIADKDDATWNGGIRTHQAKGRSE